jgi:hypothetical protein
MEAERQKSSTFGETQPVSKLYLENTLLRVAGALFCHDPKRASARTDAIEVHASVAEKKIVVRPDPEYGQPGQLAHKIFVALLKKHSDYGRPIRTDISFGKRELTRLIGRKQWGGACSDQLARALNEIHHTFVRSSFKTANGKWAEHSFSIFPEIYVERAEHEDDPIERCTVTLARPIIASLEDAHFTCLNHELMQALGTIGQAIYMRLFFHFANLFDGHHKNRLTFPKRYDDICREWLGGLKVHTTRSAIERDQLGPHMRDLIRAGFLASYAITKAKSGEGMIVSFRPGPTFFADYDRFYRHRQHGGSQFEFHDDQREVAEPLKLAYLFLEKRTGKTLSAIPYVSTKEVENAREILREVPFSESVSFIAYGLAKARATRFDVQTLGGLRQYIADYRQAARDKVSTEALKVAEFERTRAEGERLAYEAFRREATNTLFRSLPADEQAAIRAMAAGRKPTAIRPDGPLSKMLDEMEIARIAAERHPKDIQSFDVWKGKTRPSRAQ